MPVLKLEGVRKQFPAPMSFKDMALSPILGRKRRGFWAVDGVSFEIHKGEIMGLIGESGCGKTTLGKIVLGLLPNIDGGGVFVKGLDKSVFEYSRQETRQYRRRAQMIFQNPDVSLNPRMKIGDGIREALSIKGTLDRKESDALIAEYLKLVCLNKEDMEKYPDELSGGEKKRICIARVLAVQPDIIVGDEPFTGLDISLRNQIIEVLLRERQERNPSFLFISHDISTIGYLTSKIAVMYLGKIVEIGPSEKILSDGKVRHPYTRGLLSASRHLGSLAGEGEEQALRYLSFGPGIWTAGPHPLNGQKGCVFRWRCYAYKDVLKRSEKERCDGEEPQLNGVEGDHKVACHFALQVN